MKQLLTILKRPIAFFLLCVLWTCSDPAEMIGELPEVPPHVQADSISYLALGDSYTIGQGVEESDRWPNQLAVQLQEHEIPVKSLDIIARTGWTTGNLLAAIQDAAPGPQDLVSLLIGVNNQYQGLEFQEFQEEFDSLLITAIQLAGTQANVFVVSIPDYGVTPFGQANREKIAEELDMYNTYMAQRCDSIDIAFVNITEISRQLGDGANALASDKLHPSGAQYAAWVEEMFPIIIELLDE
ncbi:MAG: SGNH/GDSL hydrolase family protein [Bacteroidota bacterium]